MTAPTAGPVTNNTTLDRSAVRARRVTATVTATVKVGATTSQTRTSACTGRDLVGGARVPTLAQNAYTVKASQTDAAGNTGTSATVAFTIDTTAPVVTVTAPANGSSTNDTTPALAGACTTGDGTVTVLVKQGATTVQTFTPACTAGAWSATAAALAPNTYTVQASQTDAAGNVGYERGEHVHDRYHRARGHGDCADGGRRDEQHHADVRRVPARRVTAR